MFYLQGQNANGSVIAVTSTATNLYDLINTAASTTLAYAGYSFKANGINILPEDGDVRILFDSSLSPTASKGMLLTAGTQYFLRNVPLDKMKLIRAGGTNVSCSIAIGICDATEASTAVAGVGSSSLVEAVDVAKVGGVAINLGAGVATTGTQRVAIGSTSPQAQGTDATGQDTYATILTPASAASHLYVSLEGSNAAIISLDGGVTDHFTIQAGTVNMFDAITISASVNIQAKNRTGGSNYTNLNISVW